MRTFGDELERGEDELDPDETTRASGEGVRGLYRFGGRSRSWLGGEVEYWACGGVVVG